MHGRPARSRPSVSPSCCSSLPSSKCGILKQPYLHLSVLPSDPPIAHLPTNLRTPRSWYSTRRGVPATIGCSQQRNEPARSFRRHRPRHRHPMLSQSIRRQAAVRRRHASHLTMASENTSTTSWLLLYMATLPARCPTRALPLGSAPTTSRQPAQGANLFREMRQNDG